MFAIDKNIDQSKIREGSLFKVLFSMNVHQVANPEMSLEDARSYVFFFRDGGKFQALIGLYLPRSDRRLFYAYSSNPFPETNLADVEGEARGFAEDLGALLDEIDFSRLSAAEQKQWLDDQEIIAGRKKEPEPAEKPVPAASGEASEPVVKAPEAAPAPQSQAGSPQPPAAQSAPEAAPAPQPQASSPQQPPVQPVPQAAPAAAQESPMQPPLQRQEPPTTQQPQPVQKPTPSASPAAPQAAPVQRADIRHSPVKQAPKPHARPSFSRRASEPEGPVEQENAEQQSVPRLDDVLEEAVKAGVVKAPKAQLKKDIRNSSGIVSREKEALARLLSSF